MVIGIDGSRAFASWRTGTENYSYQLLRALSKIDQKNKYIIYLRPQSRRRGDLQGSSWSKKFQFKEIPFQRLWTQAGLSLQTFRDNLDLLFVPAHTLPVIIKPGLKTVVTVHDLGSQYLPSMHQLKQRLYLGFMQRYQLQKATKIITVSKATKIDLIDREGIDPAKIQTVYEGYDKSLFKPVRSDTLVYSLRQYGLEPGGYFLFVGTVQPRKNLERVISAFSKLISPTFSKKLVIIGSKGWLSDDIYQLPKKLGVEDRVKFLGYVPDEKLPVFYSGAAALIFPSLFEGFGLPIIEAQACGCLVITSNLSSMPEIAGKGAIYVNPYKINDIVEGMRKVDDGKLRMEKIKEGFENVKRFSWEKCAKETLAVLEKAV
ncbi:glycosyltransferase family 4 protein [Candidatus Daviesbacteria bacterium]|nr:glycosyltransferase family 4 protein [Candidatus Daviesbacteria bacterium]